MTAPIYAVGDIHGQLSMLDDALARIEADGGAGAPVVFPKPHNIGVHVGEEDWQAGPQALVDFCKAVGIKVHVVPGRGHMLGSDYVGPLLDAWLTVK